MKLFNVYRNELMSDHVYIKLNDDVFLYVGRWDPVPIPGTTKHISFDPATSDNSYNRLSLINKEKGSFKKDEKIEKQGFEVNIPSKYRKAILKKTLGGYDA